MNERPKTIWWAWGALLFFLLVVYPLSIGPAFWLYGQAQLRWGASVDWIRPVLGAIYFPVILMEIAGPEWLRAAIEQYILWWVGSSLF